MPDAHIVIASLAERGADPFSRMENQDIQCATVTRAITGKETYILLAVIALYIW